MKVGSQNGPESLRAFREKNTVCLIWWLEMVVIKLTGNQSSIIRWALCKKSSYIKLKTFAQVTDGAVMMVSAIQKALSKKPKICLIIFIVDRQMTELHFRFIQLRKKPLRFSLMVLF
jgi:hypothetical protein